MAPKRVIIDVDVGTDDYLALLVLFYGEKLGELKIEAICCSMGNTSVDNVCRNTIRLLEIIGRTDVPVYKGAKAQLIKPKEKIGFYHGIDGFGDLEHESEPDLSLVKDIPSSIALASLILGNPKEISLIFVGPLTNLALAVKLYPNLRENVKDLWIMGGNYTGLGNVTKSAEFNFFVDPEAVEIVLDCIKCPIYMLPWETCLKSTISFDWRREHLGCKSKALKLLTKAEITKYEGRKLWSPCDAFITYLFLNPDKYIVEKTGHHVFVELFGAHTRGQIVIDHHNKNQPNVCIIKDFDQESFKDIMLQIENLF